MSFFFLLSGSFEAGFGNCEVGSFTGPGLQAIDFSVYKSFAIVEHQSLQFRAEAVNVLNDPILVTPNSSIGTTFVLVNNAQGGAESSIRIEVPVLTTTHCNEAREHAACQLRAPLSFNPKHHITQRATETDV
jgi:hypothetical protein